MKNNLTEMVFVLDKSGSMCGLEKDTIGGFNAMIEKQKKLEGDCLVSTVLFSDDSVVVHDRVDISEISRMTENDYCVGGCTALVDAVGESVKHISDIHRYIRKEDIPEHTMFIVTTDGMENASHKYTLKKVKKMIEAKKEAGWEFIFLGANIDAAETAEDFGIDRERAVNYYADSKGTAEVFASVTCAATEMRRCGKVSGKWRHDIDKDYKNRK